MSAQGTSVITTAVNLFVRECEGSSPTWPINTPTGDVCTFHGTITAQVRMETIMWTWSTAFDRVSPHEEWPGDEAITTAVIICSRKEQNFCLIIFLLICFHWFNYFCYQWIYNLAPSAWGREFKREYDAMTSLLCSYACYSLQASQSADLRAAATRYIAFRTTSAVFQKKKQCLKMDKTSANVLLYLLTCVILGSHTFYQYITS